MMDADAMSYSIELGCDACFARGVTTIGGILVTRPHELLDVIGEAGSGYHFFGKSAERIVINR